ncbi:MULTISPECIES: NADPH-dependent FMN reductase [Microbacteriaceae]|uniref:NAD(P)H-dependent oxidoreductase n=1 Tax=Leucobacter weissii TaxID=1983706 RepID=A0A939ML22_9MICO|nr:MULTISPECIES: NAD(P)H-dependent oxidoreductase [Microbacteriaceae]MBO1902939.1 NAD(P)H-dependent oxidoreductase [Leucobacter weissii]
MIRVAIVIASTRPGRRGDQVARWVHEQAAARTSQDAGVEYAVVDLAEVGLPLLDEPVPAAIGDYRNDHTRRWADLIASFDGFIFVVPEYNHAIPAALKNAIDYLFAEWHDKAAAFVSYGLNGGVRAVEQLRMTLAEVKVACVRSQVALALFTDFTITDMTEPGTFAPAEHHLPTLERMLGELIEWTRAMATLRQPAGTTSLAQR